MAREALEELMKEFESELEMGHAYRNSKKPEESIKRYNIALYRFLQLCELSNSELGGMDYERRMKLQMGTAFILGRILHSIYYGFLLYKPERFKALFLLLIWKRLMSSLRNFERYFTPINLKNYEELEAELNRNLEKFGDNLKSSLDEVSTLALKKETFEEIGKDDLWFKIISGRLCELCALEICPVDIPSPPKESLSFWTERMISLKVSFEHDSAFVFASLGAAIFCFFIGWSWIGWLFIAIASFRFVSWLF